MKLGSRYRAMGNAVTVPVVGWIFARILEEKRRSPAQSEA